MKWILNVKFIPDVFKAIDERIHVILLATFFSFPGDGEEDLTSC